MATGVPKARQRASARKKVENDAAFPGKLELRLEYDGKKSIAEVLATPGCRLSALRLDPAGKDNRLYFGDNRVILASLRDDPTVCGKVKLVYIDPPFATQTTFHSRNLDHAYEDTLGGADYVEFLRERLILLHRLLADDGSFYIHLDAKMVFHIKLVMDEIFGASRYRNLITRKKCNPKNYTRKQYGNVADFILFYSKSNSYIWNRPLEKWTEGRDKEYQYIEPETGRRFMKVPVHAPGVRKGETGGLWRGKLPPPGKHWQFPPRVLDEMDVRSEIYWSLSGNPRRKIYLDQSQGVGVQDIWMNFRDAHNQNIYITGYPTEKNADLLKRIIEASSNPGDLVLDCFSGSGTTLAMAESLGRRWIGADNSAHALRTTLKRFAHGTEPMGDFVGKTSAGPENLFDAAGYTEGAPVSRAHRTISEFSLWADEAVAPIGAAAVKEWENSLPKVEAEPVPVGEGEAYSSASSPRDTFTTRA
ncbi:MAG: site-specific DNA-methyltransferase [Terriglobia bacterium]